MPPLSVATSRPSARHPSTGEDSDTPLTSASSYNDNYLLDSPLSSQSPTSPRDSIRPIDDQPSTAYSARTSRSIPLSPKCTNMPAATKSNAQQKIKHGALPNLPAHPAIHKDTRQGQSSTERDKPRPRNLNLKDPIRNEAESHPWGQYVTPKMAVFPRSSPPPPPSKGSQGPLLARKPPPVLKAGSGSGPLGLSNRRSTSFSDHDENSALRKTQPSGTKRPPPPLKLGTTILGTSKSPETQNRNNQGSRPSSDAISESDVYGGPSVLSHGPVVSSKLHSSSQTTVSNDLGKTQHQESTQHHPSTTKGLQSRSRPPHFRGKSNTAFNVLSTMASQSQSEIGGDGVILDTSDCLSTKTLNRDAADNSHSPKTRILYRPSFPTPSLTDIHFHCYQSHRNVKPSKNIYAPVPCMACHIDDFEIRWKCGWCCLRICARCMENLDHIKGRDLQMLIQSMTDTTEVTDMIDITVMDGTSETTETVETVEVKTEDVATAQVADQEEIHTSLENDEGQWTAAQIDDLLDEYIH
ncbi:hypothetical protein MMC14_001873 [Varicellaria rhodocarpa]|nr:hypothetical protein [Varicellaria rhodocarpa]